MTIFAPSSAQELQVMLGEALSITSGPCAIRFPNGAARRVPPEQVGSGLTARRVRQGGDVCILGVGKLLEAAEDAALLLAEQGVSATVWDVRVIKPLDPDMICDAARHPLVVTAEDGVRDGGAGAAVADAIADLDESRQSPPVLVLGTPDRYIPQAKPAQIHAELGLDGPGIAASVMKTRHAAHAPLAAR
jgi:1-deoxy-D-xylulose-5-phosphate synthase